MHGDNLTAIRADIHSSRSAKHASSHADVCPSALHRYASFLFRLGIPSPVVVTYQNVSEAVAAI